MVTSFPVPIQFELPNSQWSPADPDAAGLSDAFAVAFRSGSSADGYVPVMTVRGTFGRNQPTIEEAADSSLKSLTVNGDRVDLVKRIRVESSTAPSLVQLVEIDVVVGGVRFDLYQAQVIAGLIDAFDSRKQVLMSYAVTCKYKQFSVVGPEFKSFVESVSLGSQIV